MRQSPVLLGLTGHKGSGKDTAFTSIKSWGESRGLTVVRRGFADKLKFSALKALGFNPGNVEDARVLADSMKDVGEVSTWIPHHSIQHSISGREFLQFYGTEAHREIFGEDFWVDALLPLDAWHDNFEHADICVVTDVRFDNEARRIVDLNGLVWQIDRPSDQKDGHASEAGVDDALVDIVIDNSKDLDHLASEVKAFMWANYEELVSA